MIVAFFVYKINIVFITDLLKFLSVFLVKIFGASASEYSIELNVALICAASTT